ncbi:MAG: tyrosine-type recombinase/integrase [Thermoguttaceae bacterium]
MKGKATSFRVGKVRAYRRSRIWYLQYCEAGQRRRPRVGPDRDLARQMAAQINGQLEVGAPAALSFEPITIPDLRERWLEHHEQVRRSSVQTIRRYRAATEHLLNFLRDVFPVRLVSDFRPRHAEEFVRYLRSVQVAPNGHQHARKRRLLDGGVKYILETCSSLFNYAQRHRHLSPYMENPFRTIEIQRIPVEEFRPVVVFTADQERKFLEACDPWQFPLFLTLLLTGMRPGEATHLLLPDDLDLEGGWLHIRNKPQLGWQVKTRNERDIPLIPEVAEVLRAALGGRTSGTVFRQRRFSSGQEPVLAGLGPTDLKRELASRIRRQETDAGHPLNRSQVLRIARTVWRDIGGFRADVIRNEFMDLTGRMEMAFVTAPKTLRHTFATVLQDANVDPLIRNELMGHVPAISPSSGAGLGMTAVYTHTQPETKRRQLDQAFRQRPAIELASKWLDRRKDGRSPA